MYPFFTWGNITIPAYGCFILLGVFCGFGMIFCLASRSGFAREDLIYASLYAVIGVMIGAKLLYLLTMLPEVISHWDAFVAEPRLFSALFRGGFVFYGGLIGGIYGVYRYARRYRLCFLPLVDVLVVAVPLIHCFGRVGCFFAGCCYGMPYDGPGAVIYPENAFGLSGVSLFPLPLAEALGNLLIFLLLMGVGARRRAVGTVTGIYLCVYAIFRFVLEFFRYDTLRGIWLGLSTSQWLGTVLFGVGLFLLITAKKRGTFIDGKIVL